MRLTYKYDKMAMILIVYYSDWTKKICLKYLLFYLFTSIILVMRFCTSIYSGMASVL